MQNIRKLFVAILFIISGFSAVAAKQYQPHILIPDPELYSDDSYTGPDTVPVRTFQRTPLTGATQIKEAQQIKTVQPQNAQTVQLNPTVSSATAAKKDTALIKKLTATFKFKNNTTLAERRKIRLLIDSVFKGSQDNPKIITGDSTIDYQTLVHIIDSLLKANKGDSQKVIVDTPVVKKPDPTIVEIKESNSGSFIKNYWWVIALAVLVLAGLAFFIMKRKKAGSGDPKIFFSYAWDQDEALIIQLYNSLKKDGFNVIKDKENIGYKGVISKFMDEIGSADFVIVAISDKYLKSKFCMYELYEIFRNSGMNRDTFGKKLFPIRIDESINLSDPDVVNGYARYWKQQEQEWTERVKKESDSITEEQARQFQFIKRLVNDVNNILSCLADINSLNLTTLKSNDFADIKSALRNSM